MRICTIVFCIAVISFIPYCCCKRDYKPVSNDEAKKYLHTFGYIGTSNILNASPGSHITSDIEDSYTTLKNAIKKFQTFAGLRPTGELDVPTKKKMAEPRCGVTDVLEMSREPSGLAWDKTDLTYSFDSYSSDLPRAQVEDAMAKAFKMWSDVSPLNFKQVPIDGDIKIKFVSGRHDDPWPFDGNGGVLAHATLPKSGYLHFDEDEHWAYMNPEKLTRYPYTDLLSVAIHEAGHTLGLLHSRDENAIMAPFYQDSVDRYGNYIEPTLKMDDIKNIQEIYGLRKDKSPRRPWSNPADQGSIITLRPAIHGSGERDNSEFRASNNEFDGHLKPSKSTFDNIPSGLDDNNESHNNDCPFDVDAVTTVGGKTYLFSSTKVYELHNNRKARVHSLKQLFPNSPVYTQGAFTNPLSEMTYLFQDRKVYRYKFDNLRRTFKLQNGYPKKLPSNLKFNPMGALRWTDNKQYLFNANDYAVYDDQSNSVTMQGLVSERFQYFPRLEAIRGAMASGRYLIIFTNDSVFKYDILNGAVNGSPEPLRTYLEC